MAIESTKLLVAVKAFARGNALPLDKDEVQESYSAALSYASSATAYAGQTIKALVDGKYKTYVLQPSESGYTLDEVGAIKSSDLKQYVQIVDELPTENIEQGVIYIIGSVGKYWNGTEWKTVFEGITKADLDLKAPLANPAFTGTVTVNTKEVATKEFVEGLVANLNSGVPGIVDASNPLPATYKAGQTWRVAEAGTYVGKVCEPGDLIIALISRTEEGTSANDDFMVVQANISGAVTGPETAIDGNIVVFDGATGKIIKDSAVTIASLNDALTAIEKLDADILSTYTKEQSTLIQEVKDYADSEIKKVDDKLVNYYTKTEADATHKTITDEITLIKTDLNSKATTTALNEAVTSLQGEIDSDIQVAKEAITTEYQDYIGDKLGEIGDVTVKSYVDTAISTSETKTTAAVATAKSEAITAAQNYTNTRLTVIEF